MSDEERQKFHLIRLIVDGEIRTTLHKPGHDFSQFKKYWERRGKMVEEPPGEFPLNHQFGELLNQEEEDKVLKAIREYGVAKGVFFEPKSFRSVRTDEQSGNLALFRKRPIPRSDRGTTR